MTTFFLSNLNTHFLLNSHWLRFLPFDSPLRAEYSPQLLALTLHGLVRRFFSLSIYKFTRSLFCLLGTVLSCSKGTFSQTRRRETYLRFVTNCYLHAIHIEDHLSAPLKTSRAISIKLSKKPTKSYILKNLKILLELS